jgi:hypothetical protein
MSSDFLIDSLLPGVDDENLDVDDVLAGPDPVCKFITGLSAKRGDEWIYSEADDGLAKAELAKSTPKDGEVIVPDANRMWTYTYSAGQLTRIRVKDPDQPDGPVELVFDGEGNLLAE